MICIMMKSEFLNWLGSSPKGLKFRENIMSGSLIRDNNISTKLEDEAVNDLEKDANPNFLLRIADRILVSVRPSI